MKISIIAAASLNGVIGKGSKKPREIRIGLNPFHRFTRGHVVIVGRKTLKRRRGRPFKNRTTVVLTRNPNFQAPGCLVAGTFDEALDLAEVRGETEVFVLGGAEVFGQAIWRANKVYLALVGAFVEGDAHFNLLPCDAWARTEEKPYDPKGTSRRDCTLIVFEKKGMS